MKRASDHFSQVAPEYASWRPRYPEALFDYLASLVQRRALAWDCAAGSGQATIPLASRFERVVATDISVAMLGQASPNPRVEYYAATAEASGLPDRTVDLVTVAQGLHWLDVDAFYAEVHRVLAPGGVLAVWTYGLQQLGDPGLDHELGGSTTKWWVPIGYPSGATSKPAIARCRFPLRSSIHLASS